MSASSGSWREGEGTKRRKLASGTSFLLDSDSDLPSVEVENELNFGSVIMREVLKMCQVQSRYWQLGLRREGEEREARLQYQIDQLQLQLHSLEQKLSAQTTGAFQKQPIEDLPQIQIIKASDRKPAIDSIQPTAYSLLPCLKLEAATAARTKHSKRKCASTCKTEVRIDKLKSKRAKVGSRHRRNSSDDKTAIECVAERSIATKSKEELSPQNRTTSVRRMTATQSMSALSSLRSKELVKVSAKSVSGKLKFQSALTRVQSSKSGVLADDSYITTKKHSSDSTAFSDGREEGHYDTSHRGYGGGHGNGGNGSSYAAYHRHKRGANGSRKRSHGDITGWQLPRERKRDRRIASAKCAEESSPVTEAFGCKPRKRMR